jgi:hypothetical protein
MTKRKWNMQCANVQTCKRANVQTCKRANVQTKILDFFDQKLHMKNLQFLHFFAFFCKLRKNK